MSLLKPLAGTAGYLKAGFLGFSGSGKTHTAMLLALGVRQMFGLEGPIAMFDTESGSDYWSSRIKRETGKDLLGVKSRSFDDLMDMAKEAQEAGVSVLIVDSVTHLWREVCESYLQQVNEAMADRARRQNWRRKPSPRQSLEFQDWAPIKSKWAKWTDFYLNAPMHIIVCGRAGFDYDFETNERGKKELIKSGVKMKTENEFGFEPSLLVEMERTVSVETKKLANQATIIKDRFDTINGKTCEGPTFEFFRPHVEKLKPEAHAPIDVEPKTQFDVDDGEWHQEKRQRKILSEEVKELLAAHYPSQTSEDKKARAEAFQKHFGTRSWTKISESTPSDQLRRGLDALRAELEPRPADEELPEWAQTPNDAA